MTASSTTGVCADVAQALGEVVEDAARRIAAGARAGAHAELVVAHQRQADDDRQEAQAR